MVLKGEDIIIITKDDAKKLVDALTVDWSLATIKKLQEKGLLDIVDKMRDITREEE